jgi:MFS family permease
MLASMSIVAGAVVTAPLPEIYKAFAHIYNADLLVKFILTTTSLGVVIGAPITGYIMDKSGRRDLLIYSMIIYGISGFSGYFLDSLYVILVFRFILGLAVSGIMTASTALVADYYEGVMRSRMMGYSGAFVAFGGSVSVSLGGYLAEFGWRYPFLLYLFTFVLLFGVLFFINEPEIMFKKITEKIKYPLRHMSIAYGLTFIIQLSFYFIVLQIPFFMEKSINSTTTEIGIAIALSNLLGGTASINFRRIHDKLSTRIFFAIIFLSMGLGIGMIGFATSYSHFVVGLMIMGLGLGLSMPQINLWLVLRIPEHARGKILGGLTSTFFLARFISPLVADPFIEIGYSYIFIVDGILLTLIGLLFVILGQKNAV